MTQVKRVKMAVLPTLALISTLSAFDAFAHARFTPGSLTPPRNPNTLGSTRAPCGGDARTTNPVQLVAGSTVTIEFEETRPHNGNFRIAFSPASDQGFDEPGNILIDNITDVGNPQDGQPVKYQQQITVPSEPCDACTLQMKFNLNNSDYYSCSDIQIVAAIENQAPTAVIDSQYSEALAPVTVGFDASRSTDDRGITQYQWQFGDGASATGITVSHEYQQAGTYTVSLTVTDADGASNTATRTIRVLSDDMPLSAVINANVFSGKAPLPVRVSSESVGNVTSLKWTLNGEHLSQFDNQASFDWVLREPKHYTLSLEVSNAQGSSDTKSVRFIAQYDYETLSPKAFATVLMEDFFDLDQADGNRDGFLEFSELTDSFVNVDMNILGEIDVSNDQRISRNELEAYLNEDASGEPGLDGSEDETLAGSVSILMSLLMLVGFRRRQRG